MAPLLYAVASGSGVFWEVAEQTVSCYKQKERFSLR